MIPFPALQESELNKVNADLAKLKEEEKRLRAAVKQGKEQVTELMNKIKAAKAEQAKVSARIRAILSRWRGCGGDMRGGGGVHVAHSGAW